MLLEYFINAFSHNNTIRLLTKHEGGHKLVAENWDVVSMDWQVVQGEGAFADYAKHNVLGLATILVQGHYPEALNIVIEDK